MRELVIRTQGCFFLATGLVSARAPRERDESWVRVCVCVQGHSLAAYCFPCSISYQVATPRVCVCVCVYHVTGKGCQMGKAGNLGFLRVYHTPSHPPLNPSPAPCPYPPLWLVAFMVWSWRRFFVGISGFSLGPPPLHPFGARMHCSALTSLCLFLIARPWY